MGGGGPAAELQLRDWSFYIFEQECFGPAQGHGVNLELTMSRSINLS